MTFFFNYCFCITFINFLKGNFLTEWYISEYVEMSQLGAQGKEELCFFRR